MAAETATLVKGLTSEDLERTPPPIEGGGYELDEGKLVYSQPRASISRSAAIHLGRCRLEAGVTTRTKCTFRGRQRTSTGGPWRIVIAWVKRGWPATRLTES
jgi:hypothetical protein